MSWINYIGVRAEVGWGGCWEQVGSRRWVKQSIGTEKQRNSHCVLSKAETQSLIVYMSGQDHIVGNSLTSHVALVMHPSGTIHPVVDRHEFTWPDKCCL